MFLAAGPASERSRSPADPSGEMMAGRPMTTSDPTDGAIREGEPPYRPSHGDRAASPAAMHPVVLMVVWALRLIAVLLAGWAAFWSFFAMMFRLEGSDELEWVKRVDLQVGGIFALALVLFFVPGRIKKPIQCLLILGIAAGIWFCVSGFLISSHEWQHRVRSGL
jgi:hypothetical protein